MIRRLVHRISVLQGLAGGCIVLVARTANAAARTRRFGRLGLDGGSQAIFLVVIRCANGGRKHGEVDPLILGLGRIAAARASRLATGHWVGRGPARNVRRGRSLRGSRAFAVVARFTVRAAARACCRCG